MMSDVQAKLKQARELLEEVERILVSQPDDRQVDYDAAADFLDVSYTTLCGFIKQGLIPIVDMGGKNKRVCMRDLRAFRDSRRRKGDVS